MEGAVPGRVTEIPARGEGGDEVAEDGNPLVGHAAVFPSYFILLR